MLTSYTLCTEEIDRPEAACADITGQLANAALGQNTIGIIACHYEFVLSGAYEAICGALPFPVIGCTTFNQATSCAGGLFALTITVLTSDDVHFATAYAAGLTGEQDPLTVASSAVSQVLEWETDSPSMLLSFLSLNLPFSGDGYLRQLDARCPGVPHFGAIATGEDESGDRTFVLCQGKALTDGFAALLCYGPMTARFYYGSFPEERLIAQSTTVTKSHGKWVETLGQQSALDFMKRCGFEGTQEAKAGLVTIPLMHRREQDEPLIARTMVDFNEEGHALFFGELPEGSVLRIGSATMDELLDVTHGVVQRAVAENGDAATLLLFSCMGRYISLGMEITSEIDAAQAEIPDGMHFLFTYASGEICPITAHGETLNRFHNSSIVVCALT